MYVPVLTQGYSAGALVYVRWLTSASVATCRYEGAWQNAVPHYLLVAYPLGVRWALTCGKGAYFADTWKERADALAQRHGSALLVITTHDQFTRHSVRARTYQSYLAWLAPFASMPYVHADSLDADHFFRSPKAAQALRTSVGVWCTDLHI